MVFEFSEGRGHVFLLRYSQGPAQTPPWRRTSVHSQERWAGVGGRERNRRKEGAQERGRRKKSEGEKEERVGEMSDFRRISPSFYV